MIITELIESLRNVKNIRKSWLLYSNHDFKFMKRRVVSFFNGKNLFVDNNNRW